MPDSQIDFSDQPELTPGALRSARRVGRPATGNAKQLISIRIDPNLLRQIRKLAARSKEPYQTVLHKLLQAAVKRAA